MLIKFLSIVVVIFVSTTCVNAQKLDPEFKTKIGGINTADPLVEQVFFGKMKLKIPQMLLEDRRPELEEALEASLLESEDETVHFDIKMREGERNVKEIKKVHESMAKSFYNGRVHRSEFIKHNGNELYVFEMTGYWNGSKTKESWLKFFTVHDDVLYQCLIRFPEADRVPTANYRQEIIESLSVVSEAN